MDVQEIEITQAMIDAGVNALPSSDAFASYSVNEAVAVQCVFAAMLGAAQPQFVVLKLPETIPEAFQAFLRAAHQARLLASFPGAEQRDSAQVLRSDSA